MTCKDCMHRGLCYKENDYENFSDRCGDFVEEPKKGECKTCSHRDPEDKKCDCGGLERVGCQFPVSDNYYCKYYERRTWDAEEVDDEQS